MAEIWWHQGELVTPPVMQAIRKPVVVVAAIPAVLAREGNLLRSALSELPRATHIAVVESRDAGEYILAETPLPIETLPLESETLVVPSETIAPVVETKRRR